MRKFANLAVGWALAALTAETAPATDAVWNLNNPGIWSQGVNWNPAAAPGSTNGTTSPDKATFGTIITSAQLITVDPNRNIKFIDFAGNSYAYSLSGATGGTLLLTDGGAIQTSGGGSGHTDLIGTPITLEGDGGSAVFTSGSSTAGRILSITNAVAGVSTFGKTTVLTLNGTNPGNNIISGALSNGSGGGTLALVKDGSGTWILSGTNTFTGGLTIKAGTVRVNTLNALGGSGAGKVTLGDTGGSANAMLVINCSSIANPIMVQSGSSGTLMITNMAGAVLSGNITVNQDLSLLSSSGNFLKLTGKLSGSGTITCDRSGLNDSGHYIQFAGDNTGFSGDVVIHSGYFQTLGATALNASNTVTMHAGTIFDVNRYAVTIAGLNDGVGAGSAIVTNAYTANNTLTVGGAGSGSFSGALVDGANGGVRTLSLIKSGSGTQTLCGTNTYSGGTTINLGTLELAGGGSVAGSIVNNACLSFNKSGSYTTTNTLTGPGGALLIVQGGGTNNLTGSLGGYYGATTVTNATVCFNHSGVYSGLITVESGGMLGGTGTVAAVAMNPGSTLSPGNSPGTLMLTNSLTLNGNTNVFELVSTNDYDQVVIQGLLTLTNAPILKLSFNTSFKPGDQFLLIRNTNSYNQKANFFLDDAYYGTPYQLLPDTAFFATSGGVTNRFALYYHANGLTATSGGNDILLAVIPEPGTLSLLLVFSLPLLLRRYAGR